MAGRWQERTRRRIDMTANRRLGPLDEMERLCGVLAALIPAAHDVLVEIDRHDGVTGRNDNQVPWRAIRRFLQDVLGDMNEPPFGVPAGWDVYVAELMSDILERPASWPVTREEAYRCVHKNPQGGWVAVAHDIKALGLFPESWNLPLRRDQVRMSNTAAHSMHGVEE